MKVFNVPSFLALASVLCFSCESENKAQKNNSHVSASPSASDDETSPTPEEMREYIMGERVKFVDDSRDQDTPAFRFFGNWLTGEGIRMKDDGYYSLNGFAVFEDRLNTRLSHTIDLKLKGEVVDGGSPTSLYLFANHNIGRDDYWGIIIPSVKSIDQLVKVSIQMISTTQASVSVNGQSMNVSRAKDGTVALRIVTMPVRNSTEITVSSADNADASQISLNAQISDIRQYSWSLSSHYGQFKIRKTEAEVE